MTYILYGERGSGSFAVEAALAAAGARLECVDLDFARSEQLGPAHRAINPTGKVPALRLPDGHVVTESAAILMTVAELHPSAGLLPPAGSTARADACRWIVFLSAEVYPMVEIVDYPERFVRDAAGALELKKAALARLRDRFLILEAAIAGPFLLSTGFCAADLYAANLSQFFDSEGWRQLHCPKLDALVRHTIERPDIAPVWHRHFGAMGT